MAGTLDPVAIEFAFAEGAIVVGAAIFYCVEIAVLDPTERDALTADLNDSGGAGFNVIKIADLFEAHEAPFAGSSWISTSSSITSRMCSSGTPSAISARKPRTTMRSATLGGMPRAWR